MSNCLKKKKTGEHKRRIWGVGELISAAALMNFFLQKCGAYLRAELNTIAIPLSTVFTRISAAALSNSPTPQMRHLFESGA